MKAVILAAGMGSRLGDITKEIPKALLPVENTTLLGRILNDIKAMESIEEILIITGYKSEKISEYVSENFSEFNITLRYNAEYNTSNNIYSVHLCEEELKDGFMLFNCDIIYNPLILKDIDKTNDSFMIVNTNIVLDEEEMKVKVNGNRIVEVSKKIAPKEGFGEYIGILKFEKNEAQATFEEIKRLVNNGEVNIYYEDAINNILDNIKVNAKEVNEFKCTEIDTEEDYKRVLDSVVQFNIK